MLRAIIAFSVKQKSFVFIGMVALVALGIHSLIHLPLDAVPDITNNQVQVVTTSPGLPAEDMERMVTFPVEQLLTNLPQVLEIRSISRFGLSLITVVFADDMDGLQARQLVGEQLKLVSAELSMAAGVPQMMPISTGLGEIYQYTLDVAPAYANKYDPTTLRSIQDWLVKRKLAGIEGVIETSSFGGFVKQYEVGYFPEKLAAVGLSPSDVLDALKRNNANAGGGYLDEGQRAIYLRTEGILTSLEEIGSIPLATMNGRTVLVKDVAQVSFGSALRYGALTKDGKGEAVGGITLLLKDANAKATVERVKARVAEIQKTLPEGITIVPYLDRSELVARTIDTAVENLAYGGLVVALVLIFFLGNYRAGLLVASIIPLSMLFAIIMMRYFGVSANLMSLGAVDLGMVVDGAVIIVEGLLHAMVLLAAGKALTQNQMDELVIDSSVKVYKSAAFGVLIILVVFVPLLYLGGIEGKMFKPMAFTLIFALTGALILSVTYVPAAAAAFLRKVDFSKKTRGERTMEWIGQKYHRWIEGSLQKRAVFFTSMMAAMLLSIWLMMGMGAVFVPDLEEGDLAMQMAVPSGSSLEQVVASSTKVEQLLLDGFPEIRAIVSKIGTAEVPTDPMAIEDADIMILLKPKSEWTSASDRNELVALMKEKLSALPEIQFEFSQPIQLRFNELISGSKADIALKIFGPDRDELHHLGERVAGIVRDIPGADDVKLERTEGLTQWVIRPNRSKLALYGLDIDEVNLAIESAYAGAQAGVVYEGEQRYDMVLRLNAGARKHADLGSIMLRNHAGRFIPLAEVIDTKRAEGVSMISRENAQRRITVGVNVRDRSLTEVVDAIKTELDARMKFPSGYTLSYEGEYKNFQEASSRLLIAVPATLFVILMLLYFTFHSWRYALYIFSIVPFTTIGGVLALSILGMPFSISAGIGFIALFGIGVLNSIVLLSHINALRRESADEDLRDVVARGAASRLRPVLLTAITTILGFLPMALSTSSGAEVQRPLATVVIGGLLINTFLTMVYMPKLYFWLESRKQKRLAPAGKSGVGIISLLIIICGSYQASAQISEPISWDAFRQAAIMSNPNLEIREMALEIEKARSGENWQIAPTEVEYGYGQLNKVPFGTDYQWQFNQRFGSIPEHINRGKRQEARILASEADIIAFRKNFEAELKAAYLEWIVANERLRLVQAYGASLDSLQGRVKAQAQLGVITDTERHFFEAVLMRMRREKAQLEVALSQSRLELEVLCQFAVDGLLPEEDHGFGVLHPVPDSLLTNTFFKAQEVRISEGIYALKMQRSAFFPALSAGYQRAKLEGETGGDAYFLGVAFPLWYGPDKSRTRQADIALSQEQARLEASMFMVNAQARRDYEAFMSYRRIYDSEGIEFYNSAQALNNKASSAFKKGETDAYQLLQALQTAYQLHLEYLGLAADYGRSRIHLSRYDQQ